MVPCTLAVRMGVRTVGKGRLFCWDGRAILPALRSLALALAIPISAQAQAVRRPAAAPNATATPAEAQPPGPTPLDTSNANGVDEKTRARARALYDQGAQAYNESRYYQAAQYFLEAHSIYPTPQLLFNVAKAYDKLGVATSALSFYRNYLRQLPEAPDAAEVEKRVHELEATVAQQGLQQLSILSDPSRALVTIDGRPVGITPWTGQTWPGDHQLTITLDGRKSVSTFITLDPLRARDFAFTLESATATSIGTHGVAAHPSKLAPHVSTLTWLVLGTGTAALATTLVVEMAAKNTTGLTRTGAFFGGVGVTASLLGGLLLHLDLYEPSVTPTQKRRAFAASATVQF